MTWDEFMRTEGHDDPTWTQGAAEAGTLTVDDLRDAMKTMEERARELRIDEMGRIERLAEFEKTIPPELTLDDTAWAIRQLIYYGAIIHPKQAEALQKEWDGKLAALKPKATP